MVELVFCGEVVTVGSHCESVPSIVDLVTFDNLLRFSNPHYAFIRPLALYNLYIENSIWVNK